MSVIAAMRAGDAVVIGADTALWRDEARVGDGDKWVLGDGGTALGYVGDYAVGQQTMRPELLVRQPQPRTLAQRIRRLLRGAGLQEVPPGATGPDWGCDWLYVQGDLIWHIDGQLAYSVCGQFAAAGTGAETAMGAMWALRDDCMGEPEASGIIERAIVAAMALSAHCGGDVRLWTVRAAGKAAAKTVAVSGSWA